MIHRNEMGATAVRPQALPPADLQRVLRGPAPAHVQTLLWNHSSPAERAVLLGHAAPAGSSVVVLAQAQAGGIVLPAGAAGAGAVSIDLGALLQAARGLGPLAAVFGRAGVVAMVLTLGGDTPQPPSRAMKFGDLSLVLTAPAAFKKIGEPGTTAQFKVDKPGWIHLGSGQRTLDVPVTVRNGQITFDPAALQRAYGARLPDGLLAMAGRPAGVPAALQTTSSTIAIAMAGAPDPCRNEPGQRHHIIPAEAMPAHQAFLTRIGFVLDQPANLMKLPANATQRSDMQRMCGQTRPVHNGRHPASYQQAIGDKLSQIEARLNSGQINQAQARTQVNRLMSAIRQELSTGGHGRVNDAAVSNFIRSLRL